MGLIGGSLGYGILRTIAKEPPPRSSEVSQSDSFKLDQYFGSELSAAIAGKTVIDFGCGDGVQAVAMARMVPDCRVIGLDIQERFLDMGRKRADRAAVSDRCRFMTHTDEQADVIVSIDAFEHFEDPLAILHLMAGLLKPGGEVLASFGPTWLHPYGGHLFSVFPWAHLLFSEQALIRWRANFRNDGAQCFSQVDGGLNQIRISDFERMVDASPLMIDWMETVPIRQVKAFRWKPLREFGTSIVRCRLTHRPT
ncbi:MAG: class I SAM-dependent methyltransferase [Wenzhouxiangella sp.]